MPATAASTQQRQKRLEPFCSLAQSWLERNRGNQGGLVKLPRLHCAPEVSLTMYGRRSDEHPPPLPCYST